MKIKFYKKQFEAFNDKVVLCRLVANVTLFNDNVKDSEFMIKVNGRAKCHPDDAFNLEAGKKIAFQRAQEKLYEKIYKRVAARKESIDKYSLVLGELSEYLLDKFDEEKKNKNIILSPFSGIAREKVRRILELFDKMDEYDKVRKEENHKTPKFKLLKGSYLKEAQRLMLDEDFWIKVDEYANKYVNNVPNDVFERLTEKSDDEKAMHE